MKLWHWEQGRQSVENETPYSKLTLAFSKRFKFDCYLIRIPQGSVVPSHVDPSQPGYEHHRINITLRRATIGGHTYVERIRDVNEHTVGMYPMPRAYHFRPDLQKHRVSTVLSGELLLFSLGWLRKIK